MQTNSLNFSTIFSIEIRCKGGLMELSELRRRLVASRGQNVLHQEITNDDILVAAKKLSVFGNG